MPEKFKLGHYRLILLRSECASKSVSGIAADLLIEIAGSVDLLYSSTNHREPWFCTSHTAVSE